VKTRPLIVPVKAGANMGGAKSTHTEQRDDEDDEDDEDDDE
jgi:hypothetical protein